MKKLNREWERLNQQVNKKKEDLETARANQEAQIHHLAEMERGINDERKNQQSLWEDECRKAGISQKAAELVKDKTVRTGREILRDLDSKLNKIEQIIAGYITEQKKDMDRIADIIDDPGR